MKNVYAAALAIGLGCAMVPLQAAEPSQLTIYGLLDVGIVKQSGKSAVMSPGFNNWLGLRGNEDLGSGLSATFNIETRFLPNTGGLETGVFWQGESTVGLKQAGLGTVRIGRAQTPLWQQKWAFEPWWASGVNGSLGSFQVGSFASDPSFVLNAANFARVPNAVFLDSDRFGGFSLHISSQIEADQAGVSKNQSVGVKYTHGDLAALVVHEKNRADDKITYLGASYKLGPANLMGSFSAVKLSGTDFTEKNYMLAGNYAFGNSTVRAGYGKTNNALQDKSKVTTGYVYALSKRTSVYADLYRDKAGSSSTGTAVGLSHSF